MSSKITGTILGFCIWMLISLIPTVVMLALGGMHLVYWEYQSIEGISFSITGIIFLQLLQKIALIKEPMKLFTATVVSVFRGLTLAFSLLVVSQVIYSILIRPLFYPEGAPSFLHEPRYLFDYVMLAFNLISRTFFWCIAFVLVPILWLPRTSFFEKFSFLLPFMAIPIAVLISIFNLKNWIWNDSVVIMLVFWYYLKTDKFIDIVIAVFSLYALYMGLAYIH